MVNRYGWSSAGLSADLFAVIHMASRSLDSASSLPRITPAQTTVRLLNMLQEQWGLLQRSIAQRMKQEIDDKRAEEGGGERHGTPSTTGGSRTKDSFNGIDFEKVFF
jgi:hypothetical protein